MSFFTGFTAGLLLITLSEIGDKSFFIAAILAMRHPRRWVFAGAIAALFVMTVLSVLIGQAIAVFPQQYVKGVAAALFIGFGLKLLYDAFGMYASKGLAREQTDACRVVEQEEKGVVIWSVRAVLVKAFTMTFVSEWGDRTQLATITLAAAHTPLGVITGVMLGHATCSGIAVVCGRLLVGHISERLLVSASGVLFIIFGVATVL